MRLPSVQIVLAWLTFSLADVPYVSKCLYRGANGLKQFRLNSL